MMAMRSPSCTVCSGSTCSSRTTPGYLGHHRDLHLHRLEDADLVTLGDHLPFVDDDLPHVRSDLGADLSHGASQDTAEPVVGHTGKHAVLAPRPVDALVGA